MKSDRFWYKNAVFYEVYVRAFYDSNGDGHGDLKGITEKLDYLQELGVDCIWLLPIYPSPLKDDGYDIADYYHVLKEYGTLADFKELVAAAHKRGMYVIADLVLNHTSDQHPWFQSARRSRQSPYRDYYVWSDTEEKYSQARIIFIDTEKSNWTWDEQAGQYFWHRFYSSQPDLNYDNLEVQKEMENVAKFWLDLGIDGFRADAVPYLFEREATNCENLPETHDYLKRLRSFFDQHYPDKILLCEANQWPEDVRPYFGDGDEFHMSFHFPVMPRIYMALRKGDREPLEWILNRTPDIPENCQWCVFLRNHDELTLEMVTEEERQWMWSEYAPEQRMRLNLGIRRRLAPLLDNDSCKIALANSLLFTLPGSPIIYYGDEIGMGDNIWLPDRNGVRTPMQWNEAQNAGFSTAPAEKIYAPLISDEAFSWQHVNVSAQKRDPHSLLHTIRKMIRIRKTNPVFGNGEFSWVKFDHPGVAAYWRHDQDDQVLVLNNLTGETVRITIPDEPFMVSEFTDLHRGDHLQKQAGIDWSFELNPFEYRWLKKVSTR
ncbi:MAG TPA: maltose alpha-D-glucosyltransferase [Anaerolineales bacterium]|nr:maltose alpha-D-glucosyltransferase [Anaerolineales bacterium]